MFLRRLSQFIYLKGWQLVVGANLILIESFITGLSSRASAACKPQATFYKFKNKLKVQT